MVWLFVLLAVALVLGPIAYMLPSAKDKRQTALRLAARGAGLVVEIAHIPKLDAAPEEKVSAGGERRFPKRQCARYGMPFAKPLADLPRWQILKDADGQWVDDNQFCQRDADLKLRQAVRGVLLSGAAEMPADVIAIASTDRLVSVCWLEGSSAAEGDVTALANALRGLRGPLQAVHETHFGGGESAE